MTSFLNNLSANKRKKTPEQLVISAKNSMIALINHHKQYEQLVVAGMSQSYESPRGSASPLLQSSHPSSPSSHDGGPLMIESRSRSYSDHNHALAVKSRSNSAADIFPLVSQASSGSLTLDTSAGIAVHPVSSSATMALQAPDHKVVGNSSDELMDKIQQQQLNLAKALVDMKLILHPTAASTAASTLSESTSSGPVVNAEVVLSQQLQVHHLLALCIQHLWFISFEGRKDVVLIFNTLMHRDVACFATCYFSQAYLEEKMMLTLEASPSMVNLSRNTSNNSVTNIVDTAADKNASSSEAVGSTSGPQNTTDGLVDDEQTVSAALSMPLPGGIACFSHDLPQHGIAVEVTERDGKEVPPLPLAPTANKSVSSSPSLASSSGKHQSENGKNKISVLAFTTQHLVRGYNKSTPSTLTWMNFFREDNATAISYPGGNVAVSSTPTSAAAMGMTSPLLNTCNNNVALSCGLMLRECIKQTAVAKYLLEDDVLAANAAMSSVPPAAPATSDEASPVATTISNPTNGALIWLFFDVYIHLPTFDIASDAFTTLKELLTNERHKDVAHRFLEEESATFLSKFEVLLKTDNYVTRRRSLQLLANLLIDRTHYSFMMRYISNKEYLKVSKLVSMTGRKTRF